jgi:hypothetical protein
LLVNEKRLRDLLGVKIGMTLHTSGGLGGCLGGLIIILPLFTAIGEPRLKSKGLLFFIHSLDLVHHPPGQFRSARHELSLSLDLIVEGLRSSLIKVDWQLMRVQDLEGRVLPLAAVLADVVELPIEKQDDLDLMNVLCGHMSGGLQFSVDDRFVFVIGIAPG